MIDYSFKNGQVLLRVKVVPRASRTEIVGEHNGALRVKVAAPPVHGAANDELIRILAKTFSVPRHAVTIVGGQTGRLKQLSVSGVEPETVKLVLGSG